MTKPYEMRHQAGELSGQTNTARHVRESTRQNGNPNMSAERGAAVGASQLPRGLQTPKSRARQTAAVEHERKPTQGSPIGTLNRNLLKRARESQGGSSEPQPNKKRRLDTKPLEHSHRDIRPADAVRSRLSFSNRESSPINLDSASPSPDGHGRRPVPRSPRKSWYQGLDSTADASPGKKRLTNGTTTASKESSEGSRDSQFHSPRLRRMGNVSPGLVDRTSRNVEELDPGVRAGRFKSALQENGSYGRVSRGATTGRPNSPYAVDIPRSPLRPIKTRSSDSPKSGRTTKETSVPSPVTNLPHGPPGAGADETRMAISFSAKSEVNGSSSLGLKPLEDNKTDDSVGGIRNSHIIARTAGNGTSLGHAIRSKRQQGTPERYFDHGTKDTLLKRSLPPRVGKTAESKAGMGDGDIIPNDAKDCNAQLDSELMKADFEAAKELATLSEDQVFKVAFFPSDLSDLPLDEQVEATLKRYLDEFQGDNEYWTRHHLKRARSKGLNGGTWTSCRPGKRRALFSSMKALPFTAVSKDSTQPSIWGIEPMNAGGKGMRKSFLSVPHVRFTSDRADMPRYSHYVSLRNNVLAPNVTTLQYMPFIEDDAEENYKEILEEHYDLDVQDRERKITQLLKAEHYEPYITNALRDLGCTWADVLRFLLEGKPNISADKHAESALRNRNEYCREDFTRTAGRWSTLVSTLPPSDPLKLARAAVMCEAFQRAAKFPLWHIARRSQYCELGAGSFNNLQLPGQSLTCRICLQLDCAFHGEMMDYPDDDELAELESRSNQDSEGARVVNTDIIYPPKVNYRTHIEFPPVPLHGTTTATVNRPGRNRHAHHWASGFIKPDERGPFYPCHHPGRSCEDAACSCFDSKVPCEKICNCASDCPRRFPGCACSTRGGRKLVCFEDTDCACYQSGRECDPDLCGSCAVCEVLDPMNHGRDGVLQNRCRNANLQRGIPKHSLTGDSGIHGFGLYACEDIREHDFVGEYAGEIILKEEADRRGAVYELQDLSYLFTLNMTQEIDSTYFGNKTRFINHASGNKANLRARITLVNTVHRIGMYAERNIRAGEELLFDYGPKFPDEQLGGKKGRKAAPHVRNAKLVERFYEVSTHEDELGNIRASKATKKVGSKGKATTTAIRKGTAVARGNGSKRHGSSSKRSKRVHYSEEDDQGGPVNETFHTKNAGERLVAFNISDDHSQENAGGEDESDAFVPTSDASEPEERGQSVVRSDRSDHGESGESEQGSDVDDVRNGRRRNGRIRRRGAM